MVLSPCSAAKSCPTLCDPWTAAHQPCLRFTISGSWFKEGVADRLSFLCCSATRDFVCWAVKCLRSCGKEGANEHAGMLALWLTWRRVSLYVGNSFIFFKIWGIRVESCGESKLCALYFGAPMLLCFSRLNKVKFKNACPSTSIGAVRNRTWAESALFNLQCCFKLFFKLYLYSASFQYYSNLISFCCCCCLFNCPGNLCTDRVENHWPKPVI